MMVHLGHDAHFSEVHDTEHYMNPNVLIGQRIANRIPTHRWQNYTRAGISRCIYEIDDDVFSVDPSSAAKGWIDPTMQQMVEANVSAAHAVTTTTEPLAAVLRELNPNVYVIPNTIPKFLLNAKRTRHDGINVGWGGSATHEMDFDGVGRAILKAIHRNPIANMIVTGPNYLTQSAPDVKVKVQIRTPTRRVPEWWTKLSDIDIGIAPLARHRFNESKSFIKVLENAACGIPTIATNFGPYADAIEHGVTGFLCDSFADWSTYLDYLIRDRLALRQMGAAAKEWAAQYTIENYARRWEEVYLNG